MESAELEKRTESRNLTVYDAENDAWVEVNAEQQRFAGYVHQQVLLGVFVSATAIKKVFDEKLYLALGCQSRDEYIETMLPYGKRQTYRLYAVANKFNSVLGNGDLMQLQGNNDKYLIDKTENVSLKSHLNNRTIEVQTLGELGINKLYELTKLDDDELKDLVKKNKVELGNGEYSLEDIKEMTGQELRKQMTEIRKKYQARLSLVEEENETLKEEKKLIEKQRYTDAERIKNAEDLESKYGAPASLLEDKKKMLEKARGLLNEFNQVIVRCGINIEDPEGIQSDLVDIIRKIDTVHQATIGVYEDVIGNVGI